MQQLLYFLDKYKYFFYFLFLQFIGFVITVNNYSFHRSKIVSSTNFISGSILDNSAKIDDYFSLKTKNDALANENNRLKNELASLQAKQSLSTETLINSSSYHQKYSYVNGKIRKNEFRKTANFITINLGKKNGVTKEMAVINSKGIIGIVDDVSENYARVQSILNRNSKINVRFKNNFYYGTLTWNGEDYNIVQLTDIPRQAIFKKGDTIITGGKSTIFPEGILVGTVVSVPKKLSASNTLNIKLFNDMSNLGYVYVVKSYDKIEVERLENNDNE